jgi:UDP-N-acetylglucosamine 2-epimerase (non-hydrolysing)
MLQLSNEMVADAPGAPEGAPGSRAGRRGDIAVVLGTRPEIIKLAPVVAQLGERARVVWTGQHYDPLLTDVFFDRLGWARPAEQLTGVGGSTRSAQIMAIMAGLEDRFGSDRPSAVVVQGDTNTTNAAAQAAHYLGIPVAHVEAGLRSFDRAMPEEINRLVVGAVADLHCCATVGNAKHLRRAGVAESAIKVTGNTIVEATQAALPDERARVDILSRHGVTSDGYVLATIHRPENTDQASRLGRILETMASLPWPVLFPMHPRTLGAVERFGLAGLTEGIRVVQPVDHPTFLALAAHARLIVSDSGGVQEEVTVLKKPLVVVRNSTERPESVEAGFAEVTGPEQLTGALSRMLDPALPDRLAQIPSPFGDGQAGARIATAVLALTDAHARVG